MTTLPESLYDPRTLPLSSIKIPPAEDPLLAFFTNLIMRHGKRQDAARVVAKTLVHLHAFTHAPPLPILRQAVALAAPLVSSYEIRRAGKSYVFPRALSERQRTARALKTIIKASERRGGQHAPERLAREVLAVIKGDSSVLQVKEQAHKFAVLHRASVLSPPKVPKSFKV
ncbi:ribosomal protein S7 domain-containing protein [Epithele typhae]|uniref:ribosomal protein S7 domain-containing protein n=1 Tax=Epithele typhae TaxID=378194 RepID=UPI0020077732|nr:ribosomal protein S7 domain-containing protein [Epithele typhae]KAH9930520.1 ribosomal protein S7 domain-containing protein [Epithele typhae]